MGRSSWEELVVGGPSLRRPWRPAAVAGRAYGIDTPMATCTLVVRMGRVGGRPHATLSEPLAHPSTLELTAYGSPTWRGVGARYSHLCHR